MFTFLTITYNHENYIIEHLESIKYQILNFGKNEDIEIVICDDCSTDKTVELIQLWLNYNKDLFKKIILIVNEINTGIAQNYINGLKKITSKKFKGLAGDDLYYKNNVFEVLGNENVVFSPSINFTEKDIEIKKSYKSHCRIILNKNKNLFKVIQKKGNFISTPGSFFNRELFNDTELINLISKYKWIEDLPTWYYLFLIKNISFAIINKPFILRRDESGISTNKKNIKNNSFMKERAVIFRDFQIKPEKIKNKYIKKIINYYKKNIQMNLNIETRRLLSDCEKEKVQATDYLKQIKINTKIFYSKLK